MRRHTRRPGTISTLVATAALAAGLAGCSTDSTANPPELSAEQVSTVGTSVAQEIEGSVLLGTVAEVSDPTPFGERVAQRLGGTDLTTSRVRASFSGSGCPSIQPDPAVDTDNDGVPDHELLTFTLPACTFTVPSGPTVNVTGSVSLEDPAPADSGLAFDAVADGFRIEINSAASTFAETRSGSWSVAAANDGITQAYNVTTLIQDTGRPDVTVTNAWTADFVPTVSGSIVMGQPLPAGAYTAGGAIDVNNGTDDLAFTLSTATPLQFDPETCANQATSFTAGEVHASVTSASVQGFVRIVWNACQAPTFTFVPAT